MIMVICLDMRSLSLLHWWLHSLSRFTLSWPIALCHKVFLLYRGDFLLFFSFAFVYSSFPTSSIPFCLLVNLDFLSHIFHFFGSQTDIKNCFADVWRVVVWFLIPECERKYLFPFFKDFDCNLKSGCGKGCM